MSPRSSEENLLSSPRASPSSWLPENAPSLPKRRLFIASGAALAIFSFLGISYSTFWTQRDSSSIMGEHGSATSLNATSHRLNSYGPEANLMGAPTASFRDNLRPTHKYLTSWVSAGWTNDVMTYVRKLQFLRHELTVRFTHYIQINLIYLAMITERIPVLPMFTPSHIGGAVPPIDFGDVFDVPRLRDALRIPVLEWNEVKDKKSDVIDEIGCWNTWEAVQKHDTYPRRSQVPEHLKLDISYTKAPTWIKVIPNFEHDLFSSFWALASLAFPETRQANLVPPLESPLHHVSLPPDEHMLCYDYLYFVCANQPNEFEYDYSPAWRFVGRHMHWTPTLERLAEQYIRRAIGYADDQATPPWIAIHIRHGDFKVFCGESTEGCFAPIPVIARRVEEVKAELLERKGIKVDHVIMTSDERNQTWWDSVTAQGWYGVDHSQTADLLGPWYPVLIDAAIQSLGVGFVGTDRSTMSTLARRRVQSWKDGPVRLVKWGSPDADNHRKRTQRKRAWAPTGL